MPAERSSFRRVVSAAHLVVALGLAAGQIVLASAQQTEPVYISATQARARLIDTVAPVYPYLVDVMGVRGIVRVDALISTDGTVEIARARNGPPILKAPAAEAVKQWRFSTFTAGGRPVPVRTSFMLIFQLTGDRQQAAELVAAFEEAIFECESAVRNGQFEMAEARCSIAEEAATQLPFSNGEYRSNVLRLAAIAMFQREQIKSALSMLTEAAKISQSRPGYYSEEYVQSLLVLAKAHRALSQQEEALNAYRQIERHLNDVRRDSRGQYLSEKTAELRSLLLEMAETFDEAEKTRDAERARSRAESLK